MKAEFNYQPHEEVHRNLTEIAVEAVHNRSYLPEEVLRAYHHLRQ